VVVDIGVPAVWVLAVILARGAAITLNLVGLMARGRMDVWMCKHKLDEDCGMLPGRNLCVMKVWTKTYKMVCREG
jgi:hypothetical protein